jgi:hypothetical protein
MSEESGDPMSENLAKTAEHLRLERPELTALELDHLKQRVRQQAKTPAPSTTRKAPIMKSRLALTSMLAVGLLMSLSGVGLAVSALDHNSAAISQYGGGGVVGGTAGGTTGGTNGGTTGDNGVAGAQGDNGPANNDTGGVLGADKGPTGGVDEGSKQPTGPANFSGQTAGTSLGGDGLPFTGFAAIPLLLAGMALLIGGFALRRRSVEQP